MSAVQHYIEHYRAAVQQHVPDELVLSVGVFTHARRIDRTGARSAWLTDDVALAAGTSTLLAMSYRAAGMEIEPIAMLASWPRAHVVVSLHDGATLRVLLLVDGSELLELHSPRQLGAFDRVNDQLYRDLGLAPFSNPPGS